MSMSSVLNEFWKGRLSPSKLRLRQKSPSIQRKIVTPTLRCSSKTQTATFSVEYTWRKSSPLLDRTFCP
ncbi:unnamed protein product [Acanthoscelides obtectus]|uniref:Uncharacterized protein n=1 Tax=Acanthoscelides obtectus TaxID=200917 RepID=A0A9P0QA60_ACAOB|nr:unnamed protein product [Acanthoscelides obtectus]CAK1668337.1 hypothetical protein AOBTE_LOCUS26334 [Acanthoscelides obtectus]